MRIKLDQLIHKGTIMFNNKRVQIQCATSEFFHGLNLLEHTKFLRESGFMTIHRANEGVTKCVLEESLPVIHGL